MGRLFWKLFLFTLLAQLIAAAAVGTAVWHERHTEQHIAGHPVFIDRGPPGPDDRGEHDHPPPPPALGDIDGRPPPNPAFHPHRPPPPPNRLFPALLPILSAFVGSLIVALGIAWYFSKPIRNLRSAFDDAAAGNLDSRVGSMMGNRRDELSDLGRDFDRMANRLRALMDGQRRLLHDVSHELRSPLARMQAAIGLARQDSNKIETSLDRVERESMRMDKLVGELLTLSRLEAGVMPGKEELIDVDEIVLDVIEDAQFEADPERCRIDFSNRSHATVKGSPDWLRRAIENVVRNAVKYCESGGEIVIASSTDRQRRVVMIEVLDRGPGVPEDELSTIFEPFFRGNHAESSQNGHGLGLAIAKRIVEGMGGTIAAFNRAGGGLRVEIVLPLA